MKIFTFLFFSLYSFELFSQSVYSCYITFSFKDCINCNQPLRTFAKIPSQLNPKVVFRVADKKFALKYMESQLKVKLTEEQVIFSDSLYNALSNGDMVQSQVHLLWKDKIIVKSSLLKSFTTYQLEPFLIDIKVIAKLPDTLILASSNLYNSPNYLFIGDNLFQKIYIYNKIEKKIIHIITPRSVSNLTLYKSFYGDTTGYFNKIGRFKKTLESIDKFEPSIGPILLSEQNELIINWILSYAELKGKNMNILGEIITSKWLKKDEFVSYKEIPAKNGYRIQFINSVNKENAIANIYHEKDSITANTYFLAQYSLNAKSKEIVQKKLCLKFPDFALKSKTEYMYLSGKFCHPYYFFKRENLVGNIETGEYFPLLEEKIENNYVEMMKTNVSRYLFHSVVRIKNDTYRVLYKLDEEYFIADFSLSQKKQLSQKIIAIPKEKKEDNLISLLGFDDTGTKIIAFTKDKELIEITF